MRNNSVDSNIGRIPAAQAIQNNSMVKMKALGGSQLDLDPESPGKYLTIWCDWEWFIYLFIA